MLPRRRSCLVSHFVTSLLIALFLICTTTSCSAAAFEARRLLFQTRAKQHHQSRGLPFPSFELKFSSDITRSLAASFLQATKAVEDNSSKPTTTLLSTIMIGDKTKKEFCGKNVLLTGASGGLGRSLALQLAHCGVGTLILSARSEADLQKVAVECQAISDSNSNSNTVVVHVIPCDLADPASVQALGRLALEKGKIIDVLINNGGVSSRSRFVDTDLSVDERCMQINFLAGAALAKAVVPGMLNHHQSSDDDDKTSPMEAASASASAAMKRGGRIIWISSVQGLVGIPNRSSYAASKFAVQGYCEAIRAELARDGIAVHCVSPGYIRTNLSRSALTGTVGETHGVLDETTAAGADPDDVAAAILDKAAAGCADFTVAAGFSAIAAVWMRLLCPGVLQALLVKRYAKSVMAKEKAD